ncbi:TIGR02594 family protein [Zunongwangia sp. SCSIO 43204]|uniref:C40 family peptidase n=1 Tax=Zunongwangia sp. SCSIO 43204 TaxID=2779359 RepID=UPI001CA9F07F|nr:TIGR02594 family protein [Zunongwangia sp. SCSIO 43204]UAB85449.1 TIGR02594 family protein [Zunongwangia sp. SCSIO 43204]
MDLLKIAASQLGTKEISGSEDNPQIVKYAEESGIIGITNDEIAWCSTFVNWVAKKAGLQSSGSAAARSWTNIGIAVKDPKPGDIVVFWREDPLSWKGHVGFFTGFNKDASIVYCLGGNQSNAVNITGYDAKKVLSYRRISQVDTISIPQPTLKRRDKGNEVIKLQKLLNFLGYNCGDVDGDFGPKTENALKLFQANNQLTVDGIYTSETLNPVESLLQS